MKSRGWELIRWSLQFVWRHKLLLLPSFVAGTALCAEAWLSRVLFGEVQTIRGLTLWQELCYFPMSVCAVAITSFAAALVTGSIQTAYDGRAPGLIDGLYVARRNWAGIAQWIALSSIYGLAGRLVFGNRAPIPQLIFWVANVIWLMATYFAMAILVDEKCGAFDALRRSASLVWTTWVDQLRSFFSFGWRLIAALAILVILGMGVWGRAGVTLVIYLAGGAVAAFAVTSWVVFAFVLYRYVVRGQLPPDCGSGEQLSIVAA